MTAAQVVSSQTDIAWRSHAGIPIRNLWVLLVYAAGLAEFEGCLDLAIDDEAELPDVLARLLTVVVERRLRRSLTRNFEPKSAILSRVRGRIDWLKTVSERHLEQGRIGCRFEELTHDTTRNRLVRSALEAMRFVVTDREIARSCRDLARHLETNGVAAQRPSRADLSRDQIAQHDADDRLMVSVARLALDRVLPGESEGVSKLDRLARDEVRLRKIFEDAVAGFYRHELHGRDGWRVHSQAKLKWLQSSATLGIADLLPTMAADVIVDHGDRHRIVIDTKFTGIVTQGAYGNDRFKSAHIYQLYAYLRSQEGQSTLSNDASGILLHPSLDREVDENVIIQGHELRFATVDLSLPGDGIKQRLLQIVGALTIPQ
jgi:5-methylcytosine-specific restriction enzyme subunit McrC